MKKIYSKLAQLRWAQNWTQTELKERSGVSRDTISRVERGRTKLRQLTPLTINKLAKAFGMPVEEFLKKGEEDMEQSLKPNWKKAESYLNMLIAEYVSIGVVGSFGLNLTLLPLKKRLDSGEKTQKLFDEIMECE